MGYPTKVQVIRRQDSEQWYINFPAPLARALEFDKGEVVEWVIQDRHTLTLHRTQKRQVPPAAASKKKTLDLLPEMLTLWDECRHAFAQQRTAQRARQLGLSQLACLGRHTVTGLLCTAGRQFVDWSADYRLFARDVWQAPAMFGPIVRGVLDLLPPGAHNRWLSPIPLHHCSPAK